MVSHSNPSPCHPRRQTLLRWILPLLLVLIVGGMRYFFALYRIPEGAPTPCHAHSIALLSLRANPQRGDFVLARLRHDSLHSFEEQILQVLAIPGDTLQAYGRTLAIHNHPLILPDSVPSYTWQVPTEHYWLQAPDTDPDAIDSRHLGPIARSNIRGILLW